MNTESGRYLLSLLKLCPTGGGPHLSLQELFSFSQTRLSEFE